MIDVDFEWFSPYPEVDFHGYKNLLRQLFDADSQLFDLSALADLILSQPGIGSTVKVDGEETDPYAFMTVLNLHSHREKPVIQGLIKYIVEKANSSPALSKVAELLSSNPVPQVGLVFSERFINMPTEIVPPMYKMLIDDMKKVIALNEPFKFTHYLILSKKYLEIASTLDQEDAPRTKKSKAAKGEKETFYFHPEDEVLERHAAAYGTYELTKDEGDAKADSKRAFQELGVKPQGHVILIESAKFEDAVKGISEYLGQ